MMEKPVAIVTGGGRGIGAACCRALAQEGFRVGIHYRNSSAEAGKVLTDIGDGFLLQADIGQIDQVEQMVANLKEHTAQVDVLINADINSMKIEQFDAQRSLTRGIWYLTKRIVRLFMLRKNSGRIINISSVVGHTGNAGQIPYTMEKAALDAFTKSLTREFQGRNILVNSVAPGFIDTEMTETLPEDLKKQLLANIPLGRTGLPHEVAEVVAFLATKGTYMTGSIVHVNGGLYGG
jgi:3-oxoacyl-[acyl-carrier protein] reductase